MKKIIKITQEQYKILLGKLRETTQKYKKHILDPLITTTIEAQLKQVILNCINENVTVIYQGQLANGQLMFDLDVDFEVI